MIVFTEIIEQERKKERRKTRRGSINQDKIDKFKDIDLLDKGKGTKEIDLNPGIYHQANMNAS